MGIILKADLNQFQNALGLNRRASFTEAQDGQRVHQINLSISPTPDVVLACAEAFWAERNKTDPDRRTDIFAFKEAFERDNLKIRLAYDSITRSLSGVQLRPRATGGYIVLNGELLALHSVIRGRGTWLLDNAINDGAVRLNCHNVPRLLALYESRGFKEVHRAPDLIEGRPDVVWMERNESQVPNG